ncbi:MAG: ABC transporter substrate-binding protein [Peptococcaceae bacterium]|nr:ABC transporter substrate-binding protein [Peptococcaceae bacterium]
MKRLYGVFLVLVLGLILVTAGCGSKKDDKQAGGGSGDKPKEVVIGYTGPLSGPAAEYGQDCLNGIDMAVKEINAAGGFTVGNQKYTIRLEKLDDMGDPTNAVNNARRFRNQFKTPAIFNPVFNAIAPMMQINQEKGNEFIIMAYTSTPKVVQMNNKLVVAVPPPFTVYCKSFVQEFIKEGAKNAAMLVTLGAYGDEWRAAFKSEWEKAGGKIVADKPANYYTETDFSAMITACLAAKPDVMLIGGPSVPTALVIEQARNLGFKGKFILVDQAKIDFIAHVLKGYSLLEGSMGVSAVQSYPYKATPGFDQKFRQQYNKPVTTSENPLNYMALYALTRAMSAAGTVDDPVAIRAAFSKAFPMSGDDFPVHYLGITDNGRMIPVASVQRVKDGKLTPPVSLIWHLKTEDEFKKLVPQLPAGSQYVFIPKTVEE